jgi:hypothetical protein
MFWQKVLFWVPRVLSGFLTLLFFIFILEAFSPGFGWQDGLSHFIFGLAVLAITVYAWKKPLYGGIIFMLIGGLIILLIRENLATTLLMGAIPLVIGVLFYFSDYKKKAKHSL